MIEITSHLLTLDTSSRSYDDERGAVSLNHLARRAARGSVSALRDLLRIVRPRITRVLHRQGVPHQDRDDLMNEIAFKLYTNLSGLTGPGSNIEAWLGRVARNHVHDYYERRSRGRTYTAIDVAELPSASYTVGAEHLDAEELLGSLTNRERAVFELHMQGHRHEEIGHTIGISAEHSRRILADTRSRLRKKLRTHPCMAHEE